MPVQNFAHIGICVADPERSMRFYIDLLGFRPLSKLAVSDASSAQLLGLENLDLHSYFLERDGVRIELLHYVSPGHEDGTVPRPMNRRGLTHIALRVEGLAGMLAQIEQAGFEIIKPTHIINRDLGTAAVYVLDPDGVRVELIDLPGDPAQALGEPLRGQTPGSKPDGESVR
jgi:catechol 2,3-dioxygenase-like lactoylglutathione lyase family enzyme